MNQALLSSVKMDWATPNDFFRSLDDEFHFTLDVCATPQNAKCTAFFSPEQNGLSRAWSGVCWMNPPYGREIGKWMQKAHAESEHCTVVCLVPARTDTAWWHNYAAKGEVRFVRGRIRFAGAKHPAPFPSAVVIFRTQRPQL